MVSFLDKSSTQFKTAPYLIAGVLFTAGLYLISLSNYLLFHTLIELFSVLTAFVIFALAWHTRTTHDNHYLLFIGIALLFSGVLDLVHALAYKGMGIFQHDEANLATEFWIAFRFVFSFSFLLSIFFIDRKLNIRKTFSLYLVLVSVLITVILLGWFPACYVAGTGLTRFKILSEYAICLVFLAALVFLIRKRHAFDPWVLRFMVLSLLFSIASEFSFTEYASVYGFANMLGHLFLLASVASIYRAIVVTAVVEPSRLLFRDLKQREEALQQSTRRFELLSGTAGDLLQSNEPQKVVDSICRKVMAQLKCDTFFNFLVDDAAGKLHLNSYGGISEEEARRIEWLDYGAAICGAAAQNGSRIIAEHVPASADKRTDLIKSYGIKAYACHPILGPGGKVIGTLSFGTCSRETFGEDDLSLMKAVADQVAVAMVRMGDERALRRAHDELELRVKERTAALVRANEQLEREIGERREMERRTRLTNELLKLYTQKFSRKEYLDVAVELIRDWSKCRHTGIRIADDLGNIPYEACTGYTPDFLRLEKSVSIRNDQCICTRVATGEPDPSDPAVSTPAGSFCCNETGSFMDSRSEGQKGRYRGVCMNFGFKSLAVIPIRHRDKILGAVHIADDRPGMVPRANVEFVEQLAFILGEALFRFGVEEDLVRQREEQVRMNEQLRNLSAHVDAVREGERTSIAREIHDELGQVLTAIKMDASWLRNKLTPLEPKLAEKAAETIAMIDGAIQSVKRISSELRPGVLDDIGLAAAIEWAAKDFQKRTGIACTVSVDPENMTVDRMRSTALFRIFQESLTNIMRHAQATRVAISLSGKSDVIVLSVEDNGKGISNDELSSPYSFGLIGMRERVQFLHGTIRISGIPNNGTSVSVTMPIHSEKEQGAAAGQGERGTPGKQTDGPDQYAEAADR